MTMSRRQFCLSTAMAGLPLRAFADAKEDVGAILAERIEKLGATQAGVGIVAGRLGSDGAGIVARGPVNGATQFEIGSVTKGFTALLLAEMVLKGDVALDDPARRYLPSVPLPMNGRAITLEDLATHTSGLPFMPDPLPATKTDIYRFLAGYKPKQAPGANWDYSNLGYWLLGEALAARAGRDIEELIEARVLAPLEMKRTGFTAAKTLASGHDAGLQPATPFLSAASYSLMPAAGGLYSTADDLMLFLSVATGRRASPLSDALRLSVRTRHGDQALGWSLLEGGKLVFRDGGTFGYASALIWEPATGNAATVLSNHVATVADIARHLVRPEMPLQAPTAVRHTEVSLAAGLIARCAGRYEAKGEGVFVVALENGALGFTAPSDWGLPTMRLHPENESDFFATELPLSVHFEIGADGRVTAMAIHPPRGQHVIPATRVD